MKAALLMGLLMTPNCELLLSGAERIQPGLVTNAPNHSLEANSLVQQFMDFISSPPTISNLLFQQKVPMDGGARPFDGSFSRSTRFECFEARWQTNGFLFRWLKNPSDITNSTIGREFVSWSGHRHALVEPNRQYVTTWDDRDPTVAGKNVSIFYSTKFSLEPLRQVLNLGIMDVGIGVIHWTGHGFRVETQDDDQRLTVRGELVTTGYGPPREMLVWYETPIRTNCYSIRYGYTPGGKYPFLPTVITNFWIIRDRAGVETEMELDQWRILDLTTMSTSMAESAFDFEKFARPNNLASRIYTNNAIYNVGTNGTLSLFSTVGQQASFLTSSNRISRAVFYSFWGCANAAVFALFIGAKDRNRKQTNKERIDNL